LLCAAVACTPDAPDQDAAHRASLPAGAWLLSDADALDALLAGLTRPGGTPLARRASAWRQALADCRRTSPAVGAVEVLAHAPTGDLAELFAALQCDAAPVAPAPLRELRGTASLAVALPLDAVAPSPGLGARDGSGAAEPLRLEGRIDVDVASGEVDARRGLRLPEHAVEGFASLLLPAREPAGPSRLATQGALVHARLRTAHGIDPAALVRSGGQADQLFRLGSTLLAAAALDGTWELALYEPREGVTMPPIALGLGIAIESAAREGVAHFVRQLEATWPIHRRAARFAAAPGVAGTGRVVEGACFFELRILPEFAPCWAIAPGDGAHGAMLLIGWNGESLARALAAPQSTAELAAVGTPRADGAWVDLDRVARADALLRRARAGPPAVTTAAAQGASTSLASASEPPAWRRLELEVQRADDRGVRLRVRLRAAGVRLAGGLAQ